MHGIDADDSGWLAVVSTPIGNLGDMTYRAVDILKQADIIAAEDTRRAMKLLNYFEIKAHLTSYHIHNEHQKTAGLLERVQQGQKVALLSDAGTPCIADPGYLLVRDAIAAGIEPMIVPGVSAITFAAVASGLPLSEFIFGGFLPHKSGKRRTALKRLACDGQTVILYESPYRITKLLSEIVDELGGNTQVVLVREASKLHEERLRGTASELLPVSEKRSWKGEFTVIIRAVETA